MSGRRSSVLSRRKSSTPDSREHAEMANSADSTERDTEAEMVIDGHDDIYSIIDNLSTFLCTVSEDGEELAAGFQRIPNRRTHPDYFDIISEPIAFSTIRGKIQKKQYSTFSEFVKDVSQIWHNAQVYNRPSAPVFGSAVRLQAIFKAELDKLALSSQISKEDAVLPDLGELPPVEESPSQASEAADLEDEDGDEEVEGNEKEDGGNDEGADDDDDDDDGDDDDDEDDDDEDDEYGLARRGKCRKKRTLKKDCEAEVDDDVHRGRGRPPMVLTPVEARISSVLKGIRKLKAKNDSLLVAPFEKLPDKALLPDYYQAIATPIALDMIKKKVKRKKYNSIDKFLEDMNLMFENAKTYNEDQSTIYQAAVELQKETRLLVEHEKAKPDDEFRDEDGKLPLSHIEHNGTIWKVGDWAHIRNPNDLAKPTVGQIFRMWQDREGQRWINTCWYYRPEQTVHRFEKHFFEQEVVKTGQYRDHQIGEVVDRCFVMFVTRFNKGRPRGLAADKSVYVCESRYNEEKSRFNKIKTWASCMPDEVRDRDYEMDLFEIPRPMRKVPSPIKHLLREDAKDTDELPRPTWGSLNAPPIVGAVHRRPPESNETPPPGSARAQATTVHDHQTDLSRQGAILSQSRDIAINGSVGNSLSVPGSATSSHAHVQSIPVPRLNTPMTGFHTPHQTPVPLPQIPHATSSRPVRYAQPQQPSFAQNYGSSYSQSPAIVRYQSVGNTVTPGYNIPSTNQSTRNMVDQPLGYPANAYNPPRPPEVYTLPDNINEALPVEIREQFQRDNNERVLFFTAPPLGRTHSRLATEGSKPSHSLRYLASRAEWQIKRDKKRKARDLLAPISTSKHIRSSIDFDAEKLANEAATAFSRWLTRIGCDTGNWRRKTSLTYQSVALEGKRS